MSPPANPPETVYQCGVGSATYETHLDNGDVLTGSADWTSQNPTQYPTSDVTVAKGYESSLGYFTQAQFQQTLQPTDVQLQGRLVQESNPLSQPATDGCYFNGSAVPQVSGNDRSTWNVTPGNVWGYDYVGLFPQSVGYYQRHLSQVSADSCTITIPTQMLINSPTAGGTFSAYGPVIQLINTVTRTTVCGSRAGVDAGCIPYQLP